MILREIKNIFIKNRLTEGVDFVRKEWLCGDRKAYINTNYLLDFDDIKTSIFRVYNTANQVFEGSRYGTENNGAGTAIGYNSNNVYGSFFSPDGNMARWDNNIPINVENTVVMSKNGITLNGTDISSASTIPIVGSRFESVTPYLIFASWIYFRQIDNRRQKVDYKSFEISGKLHLTPCQLLKSIPATLDANNRARSAGECGMYDSISGKFYGNVASTGTFTVEGEVEPETHSGLQQIYQNKLIEGVDYETYDWLKADIPTGKTMMRLPINSRSFQWKRKFIQIGHSAYMYGNTLNYAAAVQYGSECSISLYNNKTRQNVGTFGTNPNGRLIELIGTEDSLTIDNISVSLGDLTKTIAFDAVANSQVKCIFLTSSIKVDGVTRYVPCTLLRSIQRNLDAQCKSRVAGECGMIDLISGKFYGNVANSGTFTVENDNE